MNREEISFEQARAETIKKLDAIDREREILGWVGFAVMVGLIGLGLWYGDVSLCERG